MDTNNKLLVRDFNKEYYQFVKFIAGNDVCNIPDSVVKYILNSSYSSNKKIQENNTDNSIVLIEKTLHYEVLPNNIYVFQVNDSNNLYIEKQIAINKALLFISDIGTNNAPISLLQSISYFEKKIEMLCKGYPITVDNYKDQIINILTSGDESLISGLDQFLSVQRNISHLLKYVDRYNIFLKILKNVSDRDDILRLLNLFTSVTSVDLEKEYEELQQKCNSDNS